MAMAEKDQPSTATADSHTSLSGYISGFVLSIVLTLTAYTLVQTHTNHGAFSRTFVLLMVAGLAIMQLLVQLMFFLHVGREAKPRWNLMMLLFASLVAFILVGGSLWIMHNLNYNMNMRMSPTQMNEYMNKQNGL